MVGLSNGRKNLIRKQNLILSDISVEKNEIEQQIFIFVVIIATLQSLCNSGLLQMFTNSGNLQGISN